MELIDTVADMQDTSMNARSSGRTVGLVPTMGCLHEGHLSLVRLAKEKAGLLVVSIFVNPKQFGEGEDYQSYPRDAERDVQLLESEGVDIVFSPSPEEMYPGDYSTYVEVEGLTSVLCGQNRPGHFRGVTTVVAKLFNSVKPHFAVFGEKDYQQAVVIRKMVCDLNMDVSIVLGPIVRDTDGVALSSRNTYLTSAERRDAQVIYRSLVEARQMVDGGSTDAWEVANRVRDAIGEKETAVVEYVRVVHPETLAELSVIEGEAVIAVAARFGGARLIDNIRVGERS
jgi:pantoate--beta-alanine ligase